MHAEVPAECRAAYTAAGAIPLTEQCEWEAATSATTLRTYLCTARVEFINEFCSTLPPYVESEDNDELGTGGDTGGASTGSGGDDGTETGGGEGQGGGQGGDTGGGQDSAGDTAGGNTTGLPNYVEPEINIGQGDAGSAGGESAGEENGLTEFEEHGGATTGGAGSGACSSSLVNLPAGTSAFEFVFGTTLDNARNPLISNLTNVTAALSVANLAYSVDQAEQTGDTSAVYSNILSMVFPLADVMGQDNAVAGAFGAFSEYIDEVNGGDTCLE